MIIIYPTETCYAIGCEVSDEKSIRKIFEIKKRELGKGLPTIVPNMDEWGRIALPDKTALKLAEHFWPGPLTLVCRRKNVSDMICKKTVEGFMTIACRQSSHEIASAVANQYGPLVSTSANISGGKEPFSLDEIPQSLKNSTDLVIDGGVLEKRRPSTIYDCVDMRVIRHGPITEEEINKVLKG